MRIEEQKSTGDQIGDNVSREAVRTEMELQEQEQRQHSLIAAHTLCLCSLNKSRQHSFQTDGEGPVRKFNEVRLFINVGSIKSSSLSRIRATWLFRAQNYRSRKEVLVAKK